MGLRDRFRRRKELKIYIPGSQIIRFLLQTQHHLISNKPPSPKEKVNLLVKFSQSLQTLGMRQYCKISGWQRHQQKICVSKGEILSIIFLQLPEKQQGAHNSKIRVEQKYSVSSKYSLYFLFIYSTCFRKLLECVNQINVLSRKWKLGDPVNKILQYSMKGKVGSQLCRRLKN